MQIPEEHREMFKCKQAELCDEIDSIKYDFGLDISEIVLFDPGNFIPVSFYEKILRERRLKVVHCAQVPRTIACCLEGRVSLLVIHLSSLETVQMSEKILTVLEEYKASKPLAVINPSEFEFPRHCLNGNPYTFVRDFDGVIAKLTELIT